jgi:hypothetical protein
LALALEADDAVLLDEVAKPPKPPAPVGVPPAPVAFPLSSTGAVMEHAMTATTGSEATIARDGDMAAPRHRTRSRRHFGPLA